MADMEKQTSMLKDELLGVTKMDDSFAGAMKNKDPDIVDHGYMSQSAASPVKDMEKQTSMLKDELLGVTKMDDSFAGAMKNKDPDIVDHGYMSQSAASPVKDGSLNTLEIFGMITSALATLHDPSYNRLMVLPRQSQDNCERLNHQPNDSSLGLDHHFNDGSLATNRLVSNSSLSMLYSATLPQGKTQADLPQEHKPCNHDLYPKSFSIPSTYSSEMIHVVFGEPSKTGKVKRDRASRRPSPFPHFSPKNHATTPAASLVLASTGHLKSHQLVYKGNQRNSCPNCGCFFSQQKELSAHLRRAHGIIRVQIKTEKLKFAKHFEQLQLAIA